MGISTTNKSQRDWRREIIRRLKARLGMYCHDCESMDAPSLPRPNPLQWLHLVIPDRQAVILKPYGTNTITIYNHILKGKLPYETVTLLCEDCKFAREN